MEWRIVIKIIGAVFIGAGCSGYGVLRGRIILQKSRQLRRLWELLDYGYSEIKYKASNLEEDFEHISDIAEQPYKEVFAAIYHQLHEEHQSMYEAWESGKYLILQRTQLLEKDITALQEFMQQSFVVEKRRQEELLILAISRLQLKEKEYREEYLGKEKVYRNLGVCIGFLGIILLF